MHNQSRQGPARPGQLSLGCYAHLGGHHPNSLQRTHRPEKAVTAKRHCQRTLPPRPRRNIRNPSPVTPSHIPHPSLPHPPSERSHHTPPRPACQPTGAFILRMLPVRETATSELQYRKKNTDLSPNDNPGDIICYCQGHLGCCCP